MEKLKIYLGDIAYDTVSLSTEAIPLAIGYVAAFCNKIHGSKIEITLFKYLNEIEQAIIDSPPDILGLSNYSWNQNIGIGPLIEGEDPVLHTAKKPESEIPERVKTPDYAHLLPEPIRPFTTKGVYDLDEQKHLSFTQGAGHGGSHPHLAHEFISALIEDRDPYPNAVQSANWTCVGICAHDSALKGGEIVRLPDFTRSE